MSRFGVEDLGLGLCVQASRRGGAGWAGWLEAGILKVRIHGMPVDELRSLMNACIESMQIHGNTVSFIEQQTGALRNIRASETGIVGKVGIYVTPVCYTE